MSQLTQTEGSGPVYGGNAAIVRLVAYIWVDARSIQVDVSQGEQVLDGMRKEKAGVWHLTRFFALYDIATESFAHQPPLLV